MQFRDLGAQYRALKMEIDESIRDVINSSAFILGKPVDDLEGKLAEYVERKHCIACGNGTDALQLALMVWGIGPGDAVFTSDFTYFASAGASSILGATPVLVDIDLSTFNMDPEALEIAIHRVITEGKLTPKVIIPVDLFGQPADYNKILPIAEKYGLKVLEDAAQGFGGNIKGKMAGSFGDLSATSFFPAKPLGCYGDGGAVFTDDDDIDARLRSLRAQGKSPVDKYDNREIGMNSRLDTIQAAILLPKFKAFVDYELDAVNKAANWYTEKLAGRFVTPTVLDGFYSSWAQYTILLDNKEDRDSMQAKLKSVGIPSMIYYPRGLHQQEAYTWMKLSDDLYPNTIKATKRVLSLPMHPYLTEDVVDQICDELLK
ncbi:DegT/DnrJ/EryC1/StrS family aminotransferase [Holdemania massiliensis]|uniref:DegT/DnrJ/EryC1/StrS family aminotransferase n=1 Tax=Holdemania massiliensis TaxID=1468449 RepID=UPI003521CE2E